MITISISTDDDRKRDLIQAGFEFALKKLMPNKRNLHVDIYICDMEDDVDGYHAFISKGEHEIELSNKVCDDDLITALFHEMVHVRQTERKEMVDKGLIKKWKGEEFISVFSTKEDYCKLPWEAEAYNLQEELFQKWLKH